jgi:cytochrome c peroxidase
VIAAGRWLRAALAAAAALSAPVGCGGPAGPCPQIAADLDAARCAAAAALVLPAALPASRGNAYADSAAAAEFGFYNFYDLGLSRSGALRCATCHIPEYDFQDKRKVAQGAGLGTRNTPTILNAARLTVWFWDGRADSLWSQPLFAIENPREMDTSRLALAHLIADDSKRRDGYQKAFGPLPDLSDRSRFPDDGKPGDPAFDNMSAADRDSIDRIAANVGKAFEAFERRAVSGPSALDRFLGGDASALDADARRGLAVFLRAGCSDCHGGPLLSDEKFHDAGFPALPGAAADPGRAAAPAIVAANPFNLRGPFADPVGLPAALPPEETAGEQGAFRTPSLRNTQRTGPYGHDGVFATLSDLLAFHAAALSDADRAALVALLGALQGTPPEPPWNFWPQTQRPE